MNYSSVEHFLSLRYDLTTEKKLSKSVKRFYRRQNALIDRYVHILDDHQGTNIDENQNKNEQHRVKFLTTLSLIINIVG